jgi:hypothetical protein
MLRTSKVRSISEEEARERDLTRQARLESLGVSFLRFYDGM